MTANHQSDKANWTDSWFWISGILIAVTVACYAHSQSTLNFKLTGTLHAQQGHLRRTCLLQAHSRKQGMLDSLCRYYRRASTTLSLQTWYWVTTSAWWINQITWCKLHAWYHACTQLGPGWNDKTDKLRRHVLSYRITCISCSGLQLYSVHWFNSRLRIAPCNQSFYWLTPFPCWDAIKAGLLMTPSIRP